MFKYRPPLAPHPSHRNCRCRADSASVWELERDGLKVPELPYMSMETRIDPRTGEAAIFPAGIDPGFDYNHDRAYLNW